MVSAYRTQEAARLEQRLALQQHLLQVMRSLSTELNSDTLLRLITEKASEILDADRASLFLLDRSRNELWSKVAQGSEVREIRISATAGIAGYVATAGESLNIPEAYDDPRFNQAVDHSTGYRTKTILCVPIRDPQGQVVGVLQVLNKRTGPFDAIDEGVLIALGSQAAVALQNAALVEELEKRFQRTEVLLDVMRTLSSNLELDHLLQSIMAKTTEVMHADRATLFLVDFKTKELWSKVAQGVELNEIRFPMHLGLAGHVATTGEVINIPEAYEDPRFNQEVDRRTGYRTKTILCAPIHDNEGRIIGVTQVLNKKQGVFTKEDEDLLAALSSQANIALKNAHLFEEVLYMKNYNQSILESMATGVITMDLEGLMSTVNPAAQRIFGLTPEAEGSHFGPVLDSQRNERMVATLERVFESGDPAHLYDYKFSTGAGDQSSVNVAVLPLKDQKEKVLGVVLVAEDITQEQRLMSTLSRYVSPEVAERVIAEGGAAGLGGVRQKVSVLFSDIRSYTTLTERSTAEEVVHLLNQYFSRMVRIVFKHEGTLDKYIGDAIMAVFGAPVAHEDDPLRAVRCAIDMRRELWAFNAEREAQGQPQIEFGVGISDGEAVSGNIGSNDRMDYTVIGDAVNVASRLEGLTKNFSCKILFNESVYEFVKDLYPCEYLGEEQVKGRDESVRLYGLSDDWIRAQASL